jgi:hypothetical protein
MKFEYKVVTLRDQNDDLIEKMLNEFGDDGWELAAFFLKGGGIRAFAMKRPATEQTTPWSFPNPGV